NTGQGGTTATGGAGSGGAPGSGGQSGSGGAVGTGGRSGSGGTGAGGGAGGSAGQCAASTAVDPSSTSIAGTWDFTPAGGTKRTIQVPGGGWLKQGIT